MNISCSVHDDIKWRLYGEQIFAGGDEPQITHQAGEIAFSSSIQKRLQATSRGNQVQLSLRELETILNCAHQDGREKLKEQCTSFKSQEGESK